MDILYLLIILMLLVTYYKQQVSKIRVNKKIENFVDNTFQFVVEHNEATHNSKIKSVQEPVDMVTYKKPDYLPHKLDNFYYCGALELNYKNKPSEIYLYGRPIENVHKLYSYNIFYVKDKKIEKKLALLLRKKIEKGDPVFVRDGPEHYGPFTLK
jgi:hypothetical protein